MSEKICARRDGACPYCGGRQMTAVTDPNLNPSMKKMQCASCHQWSVKTRNGVQYPVQVPTDFTSSPTVTTTIE